MFILNGEGLRKHLYFSILGLIFQSQNSLTGWWRIGRKLGFCHFHIKTSKTRQRCTLMYCRWPMEAIFMEPSENLSLNTKMKLALFGFWKNVEQFWTFLWHDCNTHKFCFHSQTLQMLKPYMDCYSHNMHIVHVLNIRINL